MKRLIVILLVFFMLYCCGCQNRTEALNQCCYEINAQIKDIDFASAKISGTEIILFDSKEKQLMKLDYIGEKDISEIISIRKDGNVVFFVIEGSVDDEMGIMFVNDDSNDILDGIKSLKRVGGNSYQYNTAE